MSGQMTSGEIEDVLASIRRLLRDDDTTDAGQGSARSRARRLVLNPDSMVMDGAAASSPRADVLVLTDPQPGPAPGNQAPMTGGRDSADDGAPSWNAPLVLSDPVVLPDPNLIATNAASGADASTSDLHGSGRTVEAVDDDHANRPNSGKPASLEERIAELEAALAREEAEWEADGGDPEVFASVRQLPLVERDNESDDDLTASPGPIGTGVPGKADHAALDEPVELTASPDMPEPPRSRMTEDEVRAWIEAEALSAFGTTLGELVEEHDAYFPDAEADDGSGAIAALTTPEVRDAAATGLAGDLDAPMPTQESESEPGALAEALPPGIALAPPRGSADPAEDGPAVSGADVGVPAPTGLDPALAAAIRGIVSEVIRDELRGALGEQLTRSVRRLVRRELMQSLNSSQNE